MSKQEEAVLILNLYDLRREETMRKARDWDFRDFNPQSFADFNAAIFGENSAYLRMVISYCDMAAPLVTTGPTRLELFSDPNGHPPSNGADRPNTRPVRGTLTEKPHPS